MDLTSINIDSVQKQSVAGETAADHMSAIDLRVAAGETAGVLRARLRTEGRRGWELACVLDPEQRLIGVLTPAQLLALSDDTLLLDVARRDWPHVTPEMDEERIASLALHHRLPAMPVVDAEQRLAGVVSSTTLMEILRREHVEDLHHMAGISRESRQARQAIEDPPLRRARDRLPWLLVGLGGSMLATLVVASFEQMLVAKPTVAVFVPGLVYLADAVGNQSENVAIRSLSLSHMGLRRLLDSELRTGSLIGLVLAALAFPVIWLACGELALASAVTLALACASVVATVLGMLLPWLFGRLGADPAYASGPLATILQDMISLLIYFGSISMFVFPAG